MRRFYHHRPQGRPQGKPHASVYPQSGTPQLAQRPQHSTQRSIPTRPLPRVESSIIEAVPFLTWRPQCDACGAEATYLLMERGAHPTDHARSRGNYCDICIIPAVHRIEGEDRHAL